MMASDNTIALPIELNFVYGGPDVSNLWENQSKDHSKTEAAGGGGAFPLIYSAASWLSGASPQDGTKYQIVTPHGSVLFLIV